MLPKGFFVVSGVGTSRVSHLNAFDKALHAAGVSQCNLVQVSSILPENCRQVKPRRIPAGTITFCVMARADGVSSETVSAGVAWGGCHRKSGSSYGIVAEASGVGKEKYLREDLKQKIEEMADSRKMRLAKTNYETTTLRGIPKGGYGSAVAALVYIF